MLLPTANQLAFSVAAFSSLSDVHKWSCVFQLALVAIGEKQPGCNSLHNCLMMLCIDLATLCGILSTVEHHMGSFASVSARDTLFSLPLRSLVNHTPSLQGTPLHSSPLRGPTMIPNHVKRWEDSGIRNLNFH